MLTKQNNPRLAYAVRIIALPLFAVVIFAFSVRTKETVANMNLPFAFAAVNKTDTIPKKQIESINVNKAKQLLTIYYTDGSCETLNEREARSRGFLRNNTFENAKRNTVKIAAAQTVLESDSAPKPLIVVDGNIIAYNLLSALDPNKIKSINVLKDASATAKYGEKGKYGVIEIETRKTSPNEKISLRTDNLTYQTDSLHQASFQASDILIDLAPPTSQKHNETPKVEKENGIVFAQTEIPAYVDQNEWRTFLSKNLQPIIVEATQKGLKTGTYTVNVRFLIGKDGSLSDFEAMNNPGYNLDKQILAIMPNAPKWKAAIQNGKAVTSYHVQPITFQIQAQ